MSPLLNLKKERNVAEFRIEMQRCYCPDVRYEELEEVPCSIVRPLTVLGDRWTLVVLRQAFAGIRRFEDFQSTLGISRSRLADRLERLVEHGILRREAYKAGRTRYEYRLTEKGLDLYPVLMALRDWGDRYMAPDGPPVAYLHEGCGGEAHVHLECDRCGAPVNAREIRPAAGAALQA
jgi:DNA-binding HxlR family transcriptional regulator